MIHPILRHRQYQDWTEIESLFSAIESAKEKGDAFEQFTYFYFFFFQSLYQVKDLYSDKIQGKAIPKSLKTKYKLSDNDDGVDGVIIDSRGRLVAYQAKFRSKRISPPSNELNNFWSEAEYADYRLVITNAACLPADVKKRKNQLTVLADRLDALPPEFFVELHRWAISSTPSLPVEKAKPRPHQVEILDAIEEGFSKVNRGKVVAACGIGKTLIALWTSELLKSDHVLFLAPSLALIRQTLSEWTRHANNPFTYLCVCSDESITNNINSDEFELHQQEIDVPVTTNSDDVVTFLELKGSSKKVIFSTYQSLEVVTAGATGLEKFHFDLIIFDEAHRTAGAKRSDLFSLGLYDENIRSKYRLFLTATERLVKPWIRDRLAENDREVFSMDDEALYGPLFYRLPFGAAIAKKIICDYRILVPVIQDKDLYTLVKKNRYLEDTAAKIGDYHGGIEASLLHKALVTLRAAEAHKLNKIISFHYSIKDAKIFANLISSMTEDFLRDRFTITRSKMYVGHVNGAQSSAKRAEAFHDFEKSQFGLLSNVRCMTEGVDIPYTDGIVFADPKDSMIDIVQAVGRALRIPASNPHKIAHIVIPIVLPADLPLDDALKHDDFMGLHNVIQAMRDQDETLAEWIDSFNLSVVRGSGGSKKSFSSKIQLILSEQINIDTFTETLAIRIADVNGNPKDSHGLGYQLGKTERKSEYRRVFRSLGDYNYKVYLESLVLPTINQFKTTDQRVMRSSLVVNHNNISHTERLGLIKKQTANLFQLTPLGKELRGGKIKFEDVFLNQMMIFCIHEKDGILYPYRAALKVIIELGSISYIEFLYSIYSLLPSRDGLGDIKGACDFVRTMRAEYPHIELTSNVNKSVVREALNQSHHVEFSERDVWTDRTTTGNQYRYFLNHMSLLSPTVEVDAKTKTLSLAPANAKKAEALLYESGLILKNDDYSFDGAIWIK